MWSNEYLDKNELLVPMRKPDATGFVRWNVRINEHDYLSLMRLL
jgi:hypothetical protein